MQENTWDPRQKDLREKQDDNLISNLIKLFCLAFFTAFMQCLVYIFYICLHLS